MLMLAWLWPVSAPAGAAPALSANDRLLQQELKQGQIRHATQRVADQLAAVIAEFERNQIAGEDVKVLRAVRSVLGMLSEKDMQVVIAFLQQARDTSDPAAGQQRATEAYARQKAIVLQLRQLIAEYERQHRLYLLSVQFRELARKETDAMRAGVKLARTTEGRALNTFNDEQKNSLRLQQIEQDAIKPEVLLATAQLEKLAREITDGPTAERPKLALQQVKDGGLVPALDGATGDLTKGLLLSATGNQRKARDQMRAIARLLVLSEDQIEALRQALHEVEEALDQQRNVIAETRQAETKAAATEAESRQAEIVDSTDLIRRDVDGPAPIAAEHLRSAFNDMQDAREALTSGDDPAKRRDKAAPKQESAAGNLEQARRALQDQLAKAEQLAAKPENTLAALKAIQEQVRELIEQEKTHKDETAAARKNDLPALAPRQGELKDKTQSAQQTAAQSAAEAAQSLGEAAGQMQKAQASLAKNQNNPAAQQAAIDALQKADQQLGQEISKLEQAEKDLAKLEALQEKLQGVIQEQQKVQFNTAKEASKKGAQPVKELAGKQDKLKTDTSQLQQEAAAPVPPAAAHLGEAKDHMAEAKGELDKPSPKTAQPKQGDALSDLYAARKEIDKKADALREMLGLPLGDNAQSLADAQAAIEKAQAEVNQAMSDLQQGQPGLIEALQQRQQKIADALGEQAQGTPAASPLPKAQQAAAQAAQKLAQSELPAAIDSMKSAQDALTQAAQSGQQAQPGEQAPNAPPAAPGTERPPAQAATPDQAKAQNQSLPSVPAISTEQSAVKKAAEALLTAMQSAPESALQQAEQHLEQAGTTIGPVNAGQMGAVPRAAQAALQTAEQAMAQGAAQTASQEGAQAQASATTASQALAQARAALALAQAGLNAQPGQQGQAGQAPGDGQAQAQGQGQKGGKSQARQPGPGTPSQRGDGKVGNWAGTGGTQGPRQATDGSSGYLSLPKRDRAALQQSQAEKYPQEYGPLVEQYLKNLSDQSGKQ